MAAAGWFYVQDDKRMGPVGVEQIVHLVVTTALPPTALVWRQGLAEWTEAERVPEIAALLPPPLPPGKARSEPASLPPRPSFDKAADHAPPPAASPRIEELRHKLEKDANPRLFAQLAEELRKAGDFGEAIRVCREGVERSPAYPSLRLTLGRTLLESGDLPAARTELEAVLQAAPDNILAERFLGECLEGLGDRAGARMQYLKALALAPGDPQLVARIRALHAGDAGADGTAARASAASAASATAPGSHADADPLAAVLDEGAHWASAAADLSEVPPVEDQAPPPPAPDPAPIPLVPVEETFEIERANDISAGTRSERAVPATSKRKVWGEDRESPKPSAAGDVKATPPPAIIGMAGAAASDANGRAAAASRSAAAPAVAPPPVPFPTRSRSARPAIFPADAAPTDGAPPPALVPDTPIAWPTGRLADHEFAELVREVYARRWTGLLTLNHMGVEKSVRVQDGRLVFAFSSSRDDRLGELLLRRGRITLHQYVDASRAIRKGIRLGTILVEQGALDARELVKVVMDHTQEIIYSAFQWTEGLYHFTEGGTAVEPITLKLSTPDVILEGIRRIELWSRIERAVGPMETRYVRARGYEKLLGEMTLSLEKLSILTGLELERDVGTICRDSTLSHFEVCRTLWAYRVIGVVQRLA
jgi:tetratricopeptide (TPR) repeat protein